MDPGWRRLGRFIVADRTPRWRTRAEFAAAAGVSERVLDDLETGKRTRYSLNTLAAVEHALGWAHGSCLRVVAGGKPVRELDPLAARMRDLWPRLSPQVRATLVAMAEAALEQD